MERLLREIEDEKARGDTAKMDAFFAKQDRINLAKIQTYYRKQRTKRFFRHTLPKIGQAAAIVIVVISLAGGVAIATSHTVRVRVMQMLVNIEEQFTEIKLVEDEAALFDVPAEWGGDNYLSYIPDGLELLKVGGSGETHYAEYIDKHTKAIVLRFQEFSESAEGNIDTENALISKVIINGQNGYMAEKNAMMNVFWSDGYRYFLLSSNGMGREKTIEIAIGIKAIK